MSATTLGHFGQALVPVHAAVQRTVRDCDIFDSLQEVRDLTTDWLHPYNDHRPHESLGRLPPIEYRVKPFSNPYFKLAHETVLASACVPTDHPYSAFQYRCIGCCRFS